MTECCILFKTLWKWKTLIFKWPKLSKFSSLFSYIKRTLQSKSEKNMRRFLTYAILGKSKNLSWLILLFRRKSIPDDIKKKRRKVKFELLKTRTQCRGIWKFNVVHKTCVVDNFFVVLRSCSSARLVGLNNLCHNVGQKYKNMTV